MSNQWGFDKKIAELQAMKYDLPKYLSDEGEKYFAKNFDKQQWNGSAWRPRLKETKQTKGKPILVRTGRLREAIQHTKDSADYKKIVWTVRNVPYAGFLNDGTSKMVKRQFIGGDKEFLHKMKARITFAYNKVMTAK